MSMQLKEFAPKVRWLDVGTIGLYVTVDQLETIATALMMARDELVHCHGHDSGEYEELLDAANERIREATE